MPRTAVVLMNLGGPDSLEAVQPFLFNLFNDRAIIRLPWLLRMPLARLIARGRVRAAREIYGKLGGASPLLANTEAQAQALDAVLGSNYRSFIAMRYWHPTSDEAARAVAAWGPDEIVLSAALSPIIDDDDDVLACRMAPGRASGGARSTDPSGLLLSRSERVYRSARWFDPADAGSRF